MISTLELPHHLPENPRNSTGSFIRLKNGNILYVYQRFNGAPYAGRCWHDHVGSDIVSRTSSDEGRTWTQTDKILLKNSAMNIGAPNLLRLSRDRIALVYLQKTKLSAPFVDCRPMIRFSDDETETWSEPAAICDFPAVYLANNNDVLRQLSTGRLVVPAGFHRFANTTDGCAPSAFALYFLSDDEGETWRCAKEWLLPPSSKIESGFQEPYVEELSDGRVMTWARTSDGAQYAAYSEDGCETWSPPRRAEEFLAPLSPMNIKRNPATGEMFAIWNDLHPRWGKRDPANAVTGNLSRNPLAMARSSDDGKNWHSHRILENEPERGYCYTAMFFTKDALLLSYNCGGGGNVCCLQDARISRIEL